MQRSMSRLLCGMGVTLVCLLATVAAHSEMPDWVNSGQFLTSAGLNLADIQQSSSFGEPATSTGSKIGTTIEGAYNYPLGKSFELEGGLMHWSLSDFSGTGLSASAFYRMTNGTELGAGIIPNGRRFLERQHFGSRGDDGKPQGWFAQLALNGYSGNLSDSGFDSVMWTAVSVGYAF